jgi:hypothetical protein
VIPIFLPPIQFAIKPKQAVDNLYFLDGAKLFLRVCTPRNPELNKPLKKPDPIGSDYVVTNDYVIVSQPKFDLRLQGRRVYMKSTKTERTKIRIA